MKTCTSARGDWGKLQAQLYLTRFDEQDSGQFDLEEKDHWKLVTRITNFNYTGLADGKFNIRVGHYEIPYGLEVSVNSNGTLRQLLTGANLGIKADWGVGVNGTLPKFKYELSLSRGTGAEIHSAGNPFILAGRVGTADDQQSFSGSPSAGLSVFYGDVLDGNGQITNRFRTGLDATTFVGPLTLLGEVSIGEDEGTRIVNGMAEVNWVTPTENATVYTQFKSLNRELSNDWDNAVISTVGIRYTPTARLALSTQYEQDLSVFSGGSKQGFTSLQARVRY